MNDNPPHDLSKPRPSREGPLLSQVVTTLLRHQDGFTDIHIEPDMPIMLRRAAGDWVDAVYGDGDKTPIMVSMSRIMAFINGIYTRREEPHPPQAVPTAWERELDRVGSLHPATVLSGFHDGDVKSYRVRCSIQKQGMGDAVGLVIRALKDVPESMDDLGLPIQVSQMIRGASSGLIVVTGPTGSGKSTTLAAMIDDLNKTRRVNILTIEDPIEFEFERKLGIINQRELHVDVPSFEAGVRDALRFVPDVIMVGEIRDAGSMRATLRAAESGHLVLCSMHAPTTVSAIRKIQAYLESPSDMQAVAGCMIGVVAQSLLRAQQGDKSNVLVYEVLNTRDVSVSQAIAQSGQDLAKVEDRLRSKQIDGSIPMAVSLKLLLAKKMILPAQAATLASTPDERREYLSMGR